jgi:hypothetical protein
MGHPWLSDPRHHRVSSADLSKPATAMAVDLMAMAVATADSFVSAKPSLRRDNGRGRNDDSHGRRHDIRGRVS